MKLGLVKVTDLPQYPVVNSFWGVNAEKKKQCKWAVVQLLQILGHGAVLSAKGVAEGQMRG